MTGILTVNNLLEEDVACLLLKTFPHFERVAVDGGESWDGIVDLASNAALSMAAASGVGQRELHRVSER